jgi:hypothetical protein
VTKSPALMKWHNSRIGFWINVVILKTFVMCYFGFCMIPFTLLKYRKWGPVYGSLYWNGLFVFGLFPLYAPAIKWVTRLGNSVKKDTRSENLTNGEIIFETHTNGVKTD